MLSGYSLLCRSCGIALTIDQEAETGSIRYVDVVAPLAIVHVDDLRRLRVTRGVVNLHWRALVGTSSFSQLLLVLLGCLLHTTERSVGYFLQSRQRSVNRQRAVGVSDGTDLGD